MARSGELISLIPQITRQMMPALTQGIHICQSATRCSGSAGAARCTGRSRSWWSTSDSSWSRVDRADPLLELGQGQPARPSCAG